MERPRQAVCFVAGSSSQWTLIIAVVSRATQGYHIVSQTVKKVLEMNPYMLGSMAAGAADCSYWRRYLGMRCWSFELESVNCISVCAATKVLESILFQYRCGGLSVGTMIAGWDNEGPDLHYCDSDGQ
jgi:20S proteasome subunit beta 5